MNTAKIEALADEEYREYCRCWQMYIGRMGRDENFKRRVREKLPAGYRIDVWPMVWPDVEYLFTPRGGDWRGARRLFIEAIQYAEGEK